MSAYNEYGGAQRPQSSLQLRGSIDAKITQSVINAYSNKAEPPVQKVKMESLKKKLSRGGSYSDLKKHA